MGFMGTILLVSLVCVYSLGMMQGGMAALAMYIDLPSLLLLILWTLPVLLGSGMTRDFLRAFPRAFSMKADIRREGMLRSMEALQLVQRAVWIAGILGFLISFVFIGGNAKNMEQAQFWANVAVAAIVLVYAALLNLLLLAVYGRLKKRYIDFLNGHGV